MKQPIILLLVLFSVSVNAQNARIYKAGYGIIINSKNRIKVDEAILSSGSLPALTPNAVVYGGSDFSFSQDPGQFDYTGGKLSLGGATATETFNVNGNILINNPIADLRIIGNNNEWRFRTNNSMNLQPLSLNSQFNILDTTGTQQFRFNTIDGSLLIGDGTASSTFHVKGSARIERTNPQLIFQGASNTWNINTGGSFILNPSTNNTFSFANAIGENVFSANSVNNRIAIGNITPGYTLDIDGDVRIRTLTEYPTATKFAIFGEATNDVIGYRTFDPPTYNAGSGMTLTSNTFHWDGALSQDATITGANTHDINFASINNIAMTADAGISMQESSAAGITLHATAAVGDITMTAGDSITMKATDGAIIAHADGIDNDAIVQIDTNTIILQHSDGTDQRNIIQDAFGIGLDAQPYGNNGGTIEMRAQTIRFRDGAIRRNSVHTQTSVSANQDDWTLGDYNKYIFRITSSANVNVTGLDNQFATGAEFVLFNVGSNTITLTHDDVASTAGNRFLLPSNTSYAIAPNAAVVIWQDNDSSAFRIKSGF